MSSDILSGGWYWIRTRYGDRTAESTRLMSMYSIMNVIMAKLRIRQSQNVEHGLLPFPPLRDNGRCRMLGIHTGGVRHPSSETNTTASRVVVLSSLMSGCRWDAMQDCPRIRCSEILFVPLYLSEQAGGIH